MQHRSAAGAQPGAMCTHHTCASVSTTTALSTASFVALLAKLRNNSGRPGTCCCWCWCCCNSSLPARRRSTTMLLLLLLMLSLCPVSLWRTQALHTGSWVCSVVKDVERDRQATRGRKGATDVTRNSSTKGGKRERNRASSALEEVLQMQTSVIGLARRTQLATESDWTLFFVVSNSMAAGSQQPGAWLLPSVRCV